MKLATELAMYGVALDPGDFLDVLAEEFHALFPALKVEQLLYRLAEQVAYAKAVRKKVRAPKLPDEVILRRLVNLRKSGNGVRPRGRDKPTKKVRKPAGARA